MSRENRRQNNCSAIIVKKIALQIAGVCEIGKCVYYRVLLDLNGLGTNTTGGGEKEHKRL